MIRGGVIGSFTITAYLLQREGNTVISSLMSGADPFGDKQAALQAIQLTSALGSSTAFIVADLSMLAQSVRLARGAGLAGAGLMLAVEVIDIWKYKNGELSDREFYLGQAGFVTSIIVGGVSVWGCGTAGAAIGTFFLPGPGTAIGAAVGTGVGFVSGFFAGSAASNLTNQYFDSLDDKQQENLRGYLVDHYTRISNN